jgi:hypothetical protein
MFKKTILLKVLIQDDTSGLSATAPRRLPNIQDSRKQKFRERILEDLYN